MAKLTAGQRRAMPSSSFALPGQGSGPGGTGPGSYPINDPGHARAALSEVSQHGSPAQKAQVRAAVLAKYPEMRQRGR